MKPKGYTIGDKVFIIIDSIIYAGIIGVKETIETVDTIEFEYGIDYTLTKGLSYSREYHKPGIIDEEIFKTQEDAQAYLDKIEEAKQILTKEGNCGCCYMEYLI